VTGALLGRVGTLVPTVAAFVACVEFVPRHDVCGGGLCFSDVPARDLERLDDPCRPFFDPSRPFFGRRVHLA
jgi:hypothetical protein